MVFVYLAARVGFDSIREFREATSRQPAEGFRSTLADTLRTTAEQNKSTNQSMYVQRIVEKREDSRKVPRKTGQPHRRSGAMWRFYLWSSCVECFFDAKLLLCNKEVARSIAKQGAVSSSREHRSEPLRDGFLEVTWLPVLEYGQQTVGVIQVAVVVNEHVR